MKDIKSLQQLLNTEITRREFLLYIGTAIIGVIGISSVLKNVGDSFGVAKKPVAAKLDNAGAYGWSGGGQMRKSL